MSVVPCAHHYVYTFLVGTMGLLCLPLLRADLEIGTGEKPLGDRRKIHWSLCQFVVTFPGEILWDRVGKYSSILWSLSWSVTLSLP
jgi:hypothetical protein